ncbi:MAG TPA: hypothetical protein P5064_04180 [Clostridia bacterium]|jgi:hypothetical protein|nr:hypothetical protein [Clostridiaceae bacterium]HOF26024.1 hypothetical protein [Clostridia bacterium]HOM33533.1 hypothetical protein [Clostridia bacterium]HOR89201.1 hypothetical protein [Clostridia bacterium]HOT70101.1 hypothetical protein [Clostridia bacterium]
MARRKKKLILDQEQKDSIYEDTKDFISYIYEDYDFYQSLVRLLDRGKNQAVLYRKVLQKNIDEIWVKRVEDALPYLDTALRAVRKDIKEVEEIKPIALSRNITVKSLRHLATHTNFIDRVDEKGNVIPNKLLNVYKDEEILTYENKFLNTLIYKLALFIDVRYEKLKEYGADEVSNVMSMDIETKVVDTELKMSIHIETKDGADEQDKKDNVDIYEDVSKSSLWARVLRIRKIIRQYQASPFITQMGKAYIRPPVMRTNAITKNVHLRECLELWLFIESYESAGFDIESSSVTEKPSKELMENLYRLLAFQYVMFRKNTYDQLDDIINKSTAKLRYNARFKQLDTQEFTDQYEFLTPGVKKVYVEELSRKGTRLTKEEVKIRKAIDNALKSERLYAAERKKAAPKQRRKTKQK